jgi:DNA-binding winged helix-turn-helix (wHTH) protein
VAQMRTRFSQFIVDSETRQLLSNGGEVHLSPKAFEMLCLLIARRPGVVGKDELLSAIWPDSHVSEANLNVLVGEVRRALADNAHDPHWIRTAHGVGFAFCGEAADIGKDAGGNRASRTRYWLVGKERVFELSEGENIIGRDPSCGVWIDDPDVSRRHACIHIDDGNGAAVLRDLNSTNGTQLGRNQINSDRTISDGDILKLGAVELKFRDGSDEPQQTRRIRRRGLRGVEDS